MMKYFLSKLNYSKYIQKLLAKKWGRFLVVFLTAAYFVIPVDVLPEIIAGPLGYVDDVVLVSLVISEFRKLQKQKDQKKLEETELEPQNITHT